MIGFRFVYPNPFWVMGLGSIALVKGGWHMWEGEGSTSWPKIQGTVRNTRVEERGGEDDDQRYEAVVEYEYQPRDQVVIATRWSYGEDNRYPTRHQAEYALLRFTPGAAVDVYYDPGDPARSVLVQGKGKDGMVEGLLGAALFIFGFWVLMQLRP